MAKIDGTKVITNEGRLSYAKLLEPGKEGEMDEGKYGTAFLFPKTDKETYNLLNKAFQQALEDGKKELKWTDKDVRKIESPIKDGDDVDSEDSAYAGMWYINARSKRKPQVINTHREPLTDEDSVYSGMYAKISVSAFAYDKGSKGVSFSLNNVLKTKDGERLSGAASAEDDFADEFDEDDDL
ncbi:MAG: DUF2815 family protein [Roseburia sp.]|nr:DUF2815 family protein [Anaeroplasma bactoclasticum]MCM1195508.1 DUF2815 family protein [Roseburia sp.]